MTYPVQGLVEIRNTSKSAVWARISGFQNRYRHFKPKDSNAYWKCLVLKSSDEEIRLQLIDLKYDVIRRGKNTKYESPVVFISPVASEKNVVLQYRLKWQSSVIVCFSIVLLFSAFGCGYGVWNILNIGWNAASVTLVGLGSMIMLGFIYWIYDKRKYDTRIQRVFMELMEKNFTLV